jgi:epoxide hydrolase 4
MQSAYANVNDVNLHYVSQGSGELMLFVHGFPEFWYAWKDQLEFFGRDRRAVALDTRGCNLSSKPEPVEAYRAKHQVEDLRALIEHLGYQSCIMVAHDWGGAAAWSFAAKHPAYLKKLVIINAPHPAVFAREFKHNPAQIQASQYMLLFREPKAERVMAEDNFRRMLAMLRGHGARADWLSAEDRRHYIEAWSQPGALTGALNYYRATPLHPPQPGDAEVAIERAAATVDVPTLVIWGERDPALLPGNLEGLEEYVPHLTIRRIAEGSHWVVHEQPALVNEYIAEFIA